jgi:hypothetical protein
MAYSQKTKEKKYKYKITRNSGETFFITLPSRNVEKPEIKKGLKFQKVERLN